MAKVTKKSAPAFAKGGSGKMFGKQFAGPQKSGVSADSPSGTGGKWAKGGGKGKMVGKQSAKTQSPDKMSNGC